MMRPEGAEGPWGVGSSLREKVDPGRTALLIVDVQNDFCADGAHFARCGADLPPIQQAVTHLVPLLDVARQAAVTVVFVQAIYDEKFVGGPELDRRAASGTTWPRCVDGTWGADFFLVRPTPDDFVVRKHRYSGFLGTDLDVILRARGVRTVVMAGVATDVCVESTARDAFMRDYHVVVVSDCTAATRPDIQVPTLERLGAYFGVVTSSSELMQIWQSAMTPAAGSQGNGRVRS
jgi:ureidoacrylate peracid hydrolase